VEPAVQPDSLIRARLRPDAGDAEGPSAAARTEARAGLYVHVPFCTTRCTYCDFATGTLSRPALERYLDAIESDIRARAPGVAGLEFTSVFFGGGTPSALASRHFQRVWDVLRASFRIADDAEVTLEANPESVRDTLLETWRACGVNRLSMGVQTFDPGELRTLGRIHDSNRPGEAFAQAKAHGFERLSLDLMFGFPGHQAGTWERTLQRALELEPEHVSAYCFIPERGTPLGNAVLDGNVALPAPEVQAEQYDRLHEVLNAAGYAAYETSNFARPGGEARGNLVYWLRRPYLGLGPSAHGLVEGRRYGNVRDLAPWASGLATGAVAESETEPHDPASAALEIVMLGLRLCSGLWREDYPADAWADVLRRHGTALDAAVRTGRLIVDLRGYRIPRSLRFVADDVIAWIAAESERRVPGAGI
jgi:oxygen-independent coproporphyrinogen-3 oxidase